MPLIVRPRGGLTAPAPGSLPQIETGLPLEFRARQLEAFFQRLTVALSLNGERLQQAEQTVERLAAVGMLIVPDWVAEYDQLRELDWLEVWEDVELPRPIPPKLVQATGPERPWHLAMINRPSGPGSPTGASVSVGIIDYGYEPTYPDLAGFKPLYAKYVDATLTTSGGMKLGIPPQDAPGSANHGSLVCVMLAGTSCGVAPNASFFVAAIPSSTYGGTQTKMISAVNWLLSVQTGAHPLRTNGCDIITTSVFTGPINASAQGTALEPVLNTVAAANTLMIAAIGNDGPGKTRPPATLPNVVAVGAVDQARLVAGLSGDANPNKPNILAPGKDIEVPNSAAGHTKIEGTSFAAPIVAGAAALILDKNPGLRSSMSQFRTTLLNLKSLPSAAVGFAAPPQGICDLKNL